MKLHFEPKLQYQMEAIESICDIFRGQETCRTEFSVSLPDIYQSSYLETEMSRLGIGNRLILLKEDILANVQDIQLRNSLRLSQDLKSCDFTVEMETGTGKTYVYSRTIFELNKRYGFTKFVIVVPSVAIKEGVKKSFEMTDDHFRALYANTPYDCFIYDSSKMGDVRNFANSPNIQIMIITVGSINKRDINNIYKEDEKLGYEKPIDLIRATKPILIVDEPQSVDGGLKGSGREALNKMNPLCTLRYSATHIQKYNMMYQLDAVDAYEKKLVKQIEVASANIEGDHNMPYIRIVSISSKRGEVKAKVEVDKLVNNRISRSEITVFGGEHLRDLTDRELYLDCYIGEINCSNEIKHVEINFPGLNGFLQIGSTYGGIDDIDLKRQMIRRTIKEHLDKELYFYNSKKRIKVLSLFFIDKVENYRRYNDEGIPQKGLYAKLFEDEFRRMALRPEYIKLFENVDRDQYPGEVHDGYFSIDKNKLWSDTQENTIGNRENAERAYNLIMKDKERLLSFDTKLKFIFSHSALKEGWDNPNVFQICTLREVGTERERRQTIGRGLRLCVDQTGERIRGFETNTLTVIANENYESFALELQKEIEADTGIRFGVVEKHQFSTISILDNEQNVKPIGEKRSQDVWRYLRDKNYINNRDEIQNGLRIALKEGHFDLPIEFKDIKAQVIDVLKKLAGGLDIKNANKRATIKVREAVLDSEEFNSLWDRIKHKTTYRLKFTNEEMIKKCVEAVKNMPHIRPTRISWERAGILIRENGVTTDNIREDPAQYIQDQNIPLPDILSYMQNKTNLKRRTILRILKESGRIDEFKLNPQQFIENATNVINKAKRLVLVDGVSYQKLGNEHFFVQDLFKNEELNGYLETNMLESTKSPHEYIVYDSKTIERSFAERLERNTTVKVYAKLPQNFKIPTPLGDYNPDWAVLVETEGQIKLYFIVETKGSIVMEDLPSNEV